MYVIATHVTLGDYTASVDFWQAAKTLHTTIRSTMDTSQATYILASRLSCENCERLFTQRFNNLFNIVNVGNCDYFRRERSAGVAITAQFHAVAEHRGGATFCTSFATVDERLCWSVFYTPAVISEATAARFLDRSRQILLQNS